MATLPNKGKRAKRSRSDAAKDDEWKPTSALKKQTDDAEREWKAKQILFEDGAPKVRSSLQKCATFLQAPATAVCVTTEEYSSTYNTVYTMCTQKFPYNWSERLHKLALEEAEKAGKLLLPGTPERAKWIKYAAHVFMYLDRFYVKLRKLPAMKEALESAMGE